MRSIFGRMGSVQGRAARARLAARVAGSVTVLALTVALVAPVGASAWKYVFQDFFEIQGGAIGAAFAVAKKCNGGKLGYYNFHSKAGGFAGRDRIRDRRSSSTCRCSRSSSRSKDVDITIDASDDFDPNVINEILDAYGAFWDDTKARWSPGELTFKHPDLIVFGNLVLAQGTHLEDFKPKDKC